MLCGLLTPDSGRGTCLGFDILTEADAIKRQVGYMTQRFQLLRGPDHRAKTWTSSPASTAWRDRKRNGADALERLGSDRPRRQLAGELSGGWKQRLALAACILHEPQLLLLDEPTAGVDPKARREFWDEIHPLAADGLTVLVSTHYMDEAERCHEIAYIAYGTLLAHGTVEEVADALRPLPHLRRHRAPTLPPLWRASCGGDRHRHGGAVRHRCTSAAPTGPALATLAPFRADPAFTWREDAPTLEDVFIHLMGRSHDNFAMARRRHDRRPPLAPPRMR